MSDTTELSRFHAAGAALATEHFRETVHRAHARRLKFLGPLLVNLRLNLVATNASEIFSYSGDQDTLTIALLIVAYTNDPLVLTGPFRNKSDRRRWYRVRDQLLKAHPLTRKVAIVRATSVGQVPGELSILVAAHVDDATFEFLSHALRDMMELSTARFWTTACMVPTTDDDGPLIVDRADLPLVMGRRWYRNDANSRIWDGEVYLDQLLCPHDTLTHRVRLIKDDGFDYTRRNLSLENITLGRMVFLPSEAWAAVDQANLCAARIIADRVAFSPS